MYQMIFEIDFIHNSKAMTETVIISSSPDDDKVLTIKGGDVFWKMDLRNYIFDYAFTDLVFKVEEIRKKLGKSKPKLTSECGIPHSTMDNWMSYTRHLKRYGADGAGDGRDKLLAWLEMQYVDIKKSPTPREIVQAFIKKKHGPNYVISNIIVVEGTEAMLDDRLANIHKQKTILGDVLGEDDFLQSSNEVEEKEFDTLPFANVYFFQSDIVEMQKQSCTVLDYSTLKNRRFLLEKIHGLVGGKDAIGEEVVGAIGLDGDIYLSYPEGVFKLFYPDVSLKGNKPRYTSQFKRQAMRYFDDYANGWLQIVS